jgi:uncharacterized protein (DUF1501 family)
MNRSDCYACREYRELSRRQFIGVTGGAILGASVPSWLPRVAFAQDDCSARDILVSIFLRGAADGLTIAPPYADPSYYAARPKLSIPPPDSGSPFAATDLDGFFGLAPAMSPLKTAFDAGHLLIVNACGSKDPSRSHFDGQRFMEVGKPADVQLGTGWLARHLMSSAPLDPAAVLRAVGIRTGLQRTLIGSTKTLPVPDLDAVGLDGDPVSAAARAQVIHDLYSLVGEPIKSIAVSSLQTIDLLNRINFTGYVPSGGTVYPTDDFGYALKSSAALIKAQVGVEAVAIDIDGWDTHALQGPTVGVMAELMTTLSNGLAAFHNDIFSGSSPNVVVAVMTEFGRRLKENNAGGTDHGHASTMLLMGHYIDGGRVLTEWPGLEPEQLFEGKDLEVTIDFRDILGEIVQKRLANPNLGIVFPDYAPVFPGVTLPCA